MGKQVTHSSWVQQIHPSQRPHASPSPSTSFTLSSGRTPAAPGFCCPTLTHLLGAMFGGGGEGGSSAARRTIVFGICIGLSFILLLVAGLVTKNWLGCVGTPCTTPSPGTAPHAPCLTG